MSSDDPVGNVSITCKSCQHQVEQPLAWLREHRSFQCPECDGKIDVDSDMIDSAANAALKGLGKLLGL